MKERINHKIGTILFLITLMLMIVLSSAVASHAASAKEIGVVRIFSTDDYEPVIGKKPGYSFSFVTKDPYSDGGTTNCNVYKYNYTVRLNGNKEFTKGVYWERIKKGDSSAKPEAMKSTDVFEEGYIYKMYLIIEAEQGYTYTDKCYSLAYKLVMGTEKSFQVGDSMEFFSAKNAQITHSYNISSERLGIVAVTWNNPLNKLSADNNEYVLDISNVQYPWDGIKASTSGLSIDNKGMYICNSSYYANWYDSNNDSFINKKFESVKHYTIRIPVSFKSNYVIPGNIYHLLKEENVSINGYPAKIDFSQINDKVIYIYQTYQSIKKAKLEDTYLKYPLSDVSPSYPARVGDWENGAFKPTDCGYVLNTSITGMTAKGVAWYAENSSTCLSSGSVLQGNKTYKVRIYLKATSGYAFDYNEIRLNKDQKTLKIYDPADTNASYYKTGVLGSDETGMSINGCYGAAQTAYIEKEYKVYPRITEINLNGFTLPAVGDHLDFNVSTPYNTLIEVEKGQNGKTVTWTDVTYYNYKDLDSDYVIEAGHQYGAKVYFRERREKGYAFPDSIDKVKVDMGGVKTGIKKTESDSLYYAYNYFNAYKYIKKIKYNITTPEAGEQVAQNAAAETDCDDKENNVSVLTNGAESVDISKCWEKSDGDSDRTAVSSTAVYETGKYYLNSGLENIIGNLTNTDGNSAYLSDSNLYSIDPNQLTIYINDRKVFEKGQKTTSLYGYNYYCYIPKFSIKDAEVTGIADKTYTGKEITQDITVKSGEKTLVKGTDYTVSYDKNVEIGTASIVIKGIGDYTDELTRTFKIVKPENVNNPEKPGPKETTETTNPGNSGKSNPEKQETTEKKNQVNNNKSNTGKTESQKTDSDKSKNQNKSENTDTGKTSTTKTPDQGKNDQDTKDDGYVSKKGIAAKGTSIPAVEKAVLASSSEKDIKGSEFGKLSARAAKTKKNSITLKWSKVKGAKGYLVFGAKCGKAKYEKLAKLSASKKSYSAKRLKKGTYYKYFIVAFDKNNKVICSSKIIHAATTGGKAGNAKTIKITNVKKNRKSLKKGKTFKLKTKQVAANKKLKIKKHRKISFESSNVKVAKVDSKGRVKAVGKGKCIIYVYAQNGIFTKVNITVK